MNLEEYESSLLNEKKNIIIGVVGSRRRNSEKDLKLLYDCVQHCINKAKEEDVNIEFVSGGCYAGADHFIKHICETLNLKLTEYLPDLSIANNYLQATSAYYARNKLIAENCTFLVAMVSSDRTGGTESTIQFCKNLNKKVIII